jgi:hypothetical protein
MSDYTNQDIDYFTTYHSRKGKILNKHNMDQTYKRIKQYKLREDIEPNQWVSTYDVYKTLLDKKRKRMTIQSIRVKGNDYKFFTANNETPEDLEDLEEFEYYDWPDCSFDWNDYVLADDDWYYCS